MGRATNLKIAREGVEQVTKIDNIRPTSLGASEWLEVYWLIKGKTADSYTLLHQLCKQYLEKVRNYELKFKTNMPMLKVVMDELPAPPTQRTPAKRPRQTYQFSSSVLPPITGDVALNVRLPPRHVFEEGKVLSDPAGIFYTSMQDAQLFFRLAEVGKASTRFLMT